MLGAPGLKVVGQHGLCRGERVAVPAHSRVEADRGGRAAVRKEPYEPGAVEEETAVPLARVRRVLRESVACEVRGPRWEAGLEVEPESCMSKEAASSNARESP